ncbi:MAG: SHOCT domain-containing protein [Ruminococcus sp.]|nr:SHOCT domain-containing protein [Ruminococcus sp.]
MNNDVICWTKTQAIFPTVPLLIIFICMFLLGCIGGIVCGLSIGVFELFIFSLPYFVAKHAASKVYLAVTESEMRGQVKIYDQRSGGGYATIKIPLEHIDMVSVMHKKSDVLVYGGGKRIYMNTNNGNYKVFSVQNADEFAQVAMEKIEEVKKKTFHNPVPAPVAAPAQSTGNDTMEKLDSLKKMLENGLITQEEFDTKRKELLEKL